MLAAVKRKQDHKVDMPPPPSVRQHLRNTDYQLTEEDFDTFDQWTREGNCEAELLELENLWVFYDEDTGRIYLANDSGSGGGSPTPPKFVDLNPFIPYWWINAAWYSRRNHALLWQYCAGGTGAAREFQQRQNVGRARRDFDAQQAEANRPREQAESLFQGALAVAGIVSTLGAGAG